MMNRFSIVEHTADAKIEIVAKTKAQLFSLALKGMCAIIDPQMENCSKNGDEFICKKFTVQHKIEIESPDLDALLVDFLSEALCLSDTNNEAYLRIDFTELSDTKLIGTLFGNKITKIRGIEIKAVTYHDLQIREENGSFKTAIVFDI